MRWLCWSEQLKLRLSLLLWIRNTTLNIFLCIPSTCISIKSNMCVEYAAFPRFTVSSFRLQVLGSVMLQTKPIKFALLPLLCSQFTLHFHGLPIRMIYSNTKFALWKKISCYTIMENTFQADSPWTEFTLRSFTVRGDSATSLWSVFSAYSRLRKIWDEFAMIMLPLWGFFFTLFSCLTTSKIW